MDLNENLNARDSRSLERDKRPDRYRRALHSKTFPRPLFHLFRLSSPSPCSVKTTRRHFRKVADPKEPDEPRMIDRFNMSDK